MVVLWITIVQFGQALVLFLECVQVKVVQLVLNWMHGIMWMVERVAKVYLDLALWYDHYTAFTYCQCPTNTQWSLEEMFFLF